ncbi:MAG: hypothetical protein J7M29_01585 [Verrucomicrobia bacterium]|nr:hypothetical protein [Verrucomicrobiota bacterium]
MKLIFSEAEADYAHYVFPYAVWAVPEPGEEPADFFERGFLPASKDLDRFYLCRHVRIDLQRFAPSSENRRVLRKGKGIRASLIPRERFEYTEKRRRFYKTYCDIRFGRGVMPLSRLDALFHGRIITHVMLFEDEVAGKEVGAATLYLDPRRLGYYYFAFYDLDYYKRNLGIYMMTYSVNHFAKAGFGHLYLGSVYSRNALYKTQFEGAEFFNGVRWSNNLRELKCLLQRGAQKQDHHLLENEDYLRRFYGGGVEKAAEKTPFRCRWEPSKEGQK